VSGATRAARLFAADANVAWRRDSCLENQRRPEKSVSMIRPIAIAAIGIMLQNPCRAQTIAFDSAINNPDKVAWELFALVNRPVANINGVQFETWASNEDTFQTNPKFPGTAGSPDCGVPVVAARQLGAPQIQEVVTPTVSPKILNIPALVALAPRPRGAQPHVVRALPNEQASEEARRNKATFDFIVCNKLHTRAGLRAAFASGQTISFPIGAIEVKANWVPAGNKSPSEFYINMASDNNRYALVSMHITSKQIPNWTWATFEHKDNLGRCEYTGCHDNFGAMVKDVAPQPQLGGRYDSCVKTAALKSMFADAGLPALWENYCLKGSQVDFVTATGLPTILGNSITEGNFDDTSSCMTCHARAAVNLSGQQTTTAGFIDAASNPAACPGGTQRPCSPNGMPKPSWFWRNPGDTTRSLLALQTDFVWSIARHAIGP